MTTEKVKYGVHSEAGKLRKVMVCSPGLAHQRLTPNNCDELLFDDVLWVAQAKRDHFDFVTKMRERDIDVLEMHNLLTDIVAIPEALDWILERKITANTVGLGLVDEVSSWLRSLEPRKISEFLIGGVSADDLPSSFGGKTIEMFRDFLGHSSFILPPLPNTQFTRDTTCWIYGGVTLNPMYWPARRQETLLASAIYKFHPEFTNADFQIWYGDPDQEHGASTLEGGDVMPIGNGVVLIGMGERSSHQAIGQLARNLFKNKAVEKVIVAGLPKSRAAMHLDTVFSFCDRDLVTVFPEVVNQIVPFTLRPDESKPHGIDIQREKNQLPRNRRRGPQPQGAACGRDRRQQLRRRTRAVGRRQQRGRGGAWRSDRLRPQHLHQHLAAQGRRGSHHHQCRRTRPRPWRWPLHDLPDHPRPYRLLISRPWPSPIRRRPRG